MRVTVVEGDLPLDLESAMRASGRVAVDTETSGLQWSSDKLQVCQVYAKNTGPVLLRGVQDQPVGLGRLLADRNVTKIFHFAPFDLRFLEAQWGLTTVNVQCTKAASRLLDPQLPTSEHSLQALLGRHLGVKIGKGAVRTSDWGAQNLTEEQLNYAADDVLHLPALMDIMGERLAFARKAELFAQVCAYMPLDAHLEVSGYPNPLNY